MWMDRSIVHFGACQPSQVFLGPLPLHGGDETLGERPADDDVHLTVVDHDSVIRGYEFTYEDVMEMK